MCLYADQVTVEEKRDLNEKINMLESEDLGKMVEIIKVFVFALSSAELTVSGRRDA